MLVDGERYFLKGYRFDDGEQVAEIHKIKFFFSSEGVPVILPLRNSEGNTYFSIDGKYYALFPFVKGVHHNRGSMPSAAVSALGTFLAKLHKAGAKCNFPVRGTFKHKGPERFKVGAEEILGIIRSKKSLDYFDEKALEGLEFKMVVSQRDGVDVDTLLIDPFVLLHGDFHEQNVFFDDAMQIKYVFDFEKAVMGPRAFEFWRSADYMFLNGTFSDDRLTHVAAYLKAYNRENPISKPELARGLEIYYQRIIHSLWIEKEHYLEGSTRTDHFLDNETVKYLSEKRVEFLNKIISL
ncbi:MAG: phosphotransferase [Candidatus Paceibacterota bacterium]